MVSWKGKGSGEEGDSGRQPYCFSNVVFRLVRVLCSRAQAGKKWNYEQVPGDLVTTIVFGARMQKSGQKKVQNRELDF